MVGTGGVVGNGVIVGSGGTVGTGGSVGMAVGVGKNTGTEVGVAVGSCGADVPGVGVRVFERGGVATPVPEFGVGVAVRVNVGCAPSGSPTVLLGPPGVDVGPAGGGN
jgi:hypothetical protein